MRYLIKVLVLACWFIASIANSNVMAFTVTPGNDLYYVYSASYPDLAWDLRGHNTVAERKGGKIMLWVNDNGADRFIKVIPHPTEKDYFYFQPQHSYYVADACGGVKIPGAEVQLWDKIDNNPAQMFKLIQVSGVKDTYYIQNKKTGLYLTAHPLVDNKSNITQEEHRANAKDQQWLMKLAKGSDMLPPTANYIYAMENVMSKRFIDLPGSAPNQEKKDGELQLWEMDYDPDRYFRLLATDNGYTQIQPCHTTDVWDIEGKSKEDGADLQLYPSSKSLNQQFKFIYAGEPMTYYIQDRNSGKFIDAVMKNALTNGCDLKIYPRNNLDNQKWRLYVYEIYPIPSLGQAFYIKAAYTDNYWDLLGKDTENNIVGQKLVMWDLDYGKDRVYKFYSANEDRWVVIEAQNGGKRVDVVDENKKGGNLVLQNANGKNSQKFAIQFTSPTTFVFRTHTWKTVDIAKGNKDSWKSNGTELIQWDTHYGANQQFQLVYDGGPNNGAVYEFPEYTAGPLMPKPAEVTGTLVNFTEYTITDQRIKELINARKFSWGYTTYKDDAGALVLVINSDSSNGNDIVKVEEQDGVVNVYVTETPKSASGAYTVVRLHTTNTRIAVKGVDGSNYGYFKLEEPADAGGKVAAAEFEKIKGYVQKYAPELRFAQGEISYPSPVEDLLNRTYMASPFVDDHTKLTTGRRPELAMDDSGTVLEIHHTTDQYLHVDGLATNYSHEIHWRIGTVNGTKIDFSGHKNLTTGVNPSIALNNQSIVVEAHRHSSNDGIDLRYGTLNKSTKSIDFTRVGDLTNGDHPSVAINDNNIFIMVNQYGDRLEYHFGKIENSKLTFYGKKMLIPYNGEKPSVAINKAGQIVLTYEAGDELYYMIGLFTGEKDKPITFTRPVYLGNGENPSIALNNAGDILEIHQSDGKTLRPNPGGKVGLYTMLYYRYGQLCMNYGVGDPYIEFSSHIELCSGVTPDVTINNTGGMVQIHETSSITNSELHYRLSSTGYKRNAVVSLADITGSSNYILAPKGQQSWDAPYGRKTYVAVKKWRDGYEIQYNFFYPMNGTNFSGLSFMKHVGDWERIYVRVDAKGNFAEAQYHFHAEHAIYKKDKLDFVGGTHPVVYVGLETHASYPGGLVALGHGDSTGSASITRFDNLFEIVKIDDTVLNNNNWINWRGHWGTSLNSPTCKIGR